MCLLNDVPRCHAARRIPAASAPEAGRLPRGFSGLRARQPVPVMDGADHCGNDHGAETKFPPDPGRLSPAA